MKVKISDTTFTKIANLSFAPEADVAGTSMPINEFTVDIHSNDLSTVTRGAAISLWDDLSQLWAKYIITYAEKLDENIMHVRAQSKVLFLDRVTLPAVMYSAEPLADIVDALMEAAGIESDDYHISTHFDGETITGFCPEQTARERLLWVCFVIGGYIKTFFNNTISILPIDETETTVPIDKTYWKPVISHQEYVTAVTATVYTFTQGTPTVTDDYVYDGTNYYIVTTQKVRLANPSLPGNVETNEVSVDDVMLINSDNVDDVLSHLAKYYFNRTQVDLDVINNRDYMPGQKLEVYTDEENLVTGYADKFTFTFGLQAKSSIHLIGVEEVESGNLTIKYVYQTKTIGKRKYTFPVGYEYTITNPYLDVAYEGHRYVFRPLNVAATGTMAAGSNTNTQEYAVALDLEESTDYLHVISVDDVELDEPDIFTTIGVIS